MIKYLLLFDLFLVPQNKLEDFTLEKYQYDLSSSRVTKEKSPFGINSIDLNQKTI